MWEEEMRMDVIDKSTLNLIRKKNKTIHFNITNRCNVKCRHCINTCSETVLGEAEESWVLSCLTKVTELGYRRINIVGGEPFLRREFLKRIVDKANELGISSSITTTDIISRFQYVVERYADEKALTYKNESYTYRELNRITDAVAKIIGKYTKPGMVVGIFMDKSAEYVISILAILKAGCTYLPLDSLYPVSRIQTMLEDSGCKVVVSKQERNDIEARVFPSI